MSGGIDDGEDGLGGLELPESNVDGDTALALGLQFVQHPSVLERRLAHLSGLLLELLDGALVNTTALVDQVPSGGRLASIDVADDDQVHVHLVLTHCVFHRLKVLLLFNNKNKEVKQVWNRTIIHVCLFYLV